MYTYLAEVGKVLDADPDVVNAMVQMPSQNGAAGSNSGIMRVIPLAKNQKLNADEVARDLRQVKLSRFPGINVFIANPPSISIGGRSGRSTYQYTMQDTDLDELKLYSDRLVDYFEGPARLCRCQQRSGCGDAVGACRD